MNTWQALKKIVRDQFTRPVPPVRQESCPTRLMDGRNEIRCWLTAGHEGDCK